MCWYWPVHTITHIYQGPKLHSDHLLSCLYAKLKIETIDLMYFKVTESNAFLLTIYPKKVRKNGGGQWHYCALLCWAALWSSLLRPGCCHTHIRDNSSCFRYIGHGHVFHSPLSYLVLAGLLLDVDIYHGESGLSPWLTIYHIINISRSGQYLYSCSCKSSGHSQSPRSSHVIHSHKKIPFL